MEAKFYEPKYKDGKIVALADVQVGGGITVRGFRVVNGTNGMFAAVPSRPVTVEGQTRYVNQVVFDTRENGNRFLANLLEAYETWSRSGT